MKLLRPASIPTEVLCACVTLVSQEWVQTAHVKVCKFHVVHSTCVKDMFAVSDINECLNVSTSGCDRNAVCLNNIGSFECQCSPGYIGNGFTCSKITTACV